MLPNRELIKEAYKEFIDGQLAFHIKVNKILTCSSNILSFLPQAVEDQDKLVMDQEAMKRDLSFDVVGCTLFDTILEVMSLMC